MITLTKGDIVKAHTEAIVNSVNIVGIMGKGVALAFKNAFPDNYNSYKKACENKELDIGKLFITETSQLYPKYIINFPTKKHWKNPSKYEYIIEGLKELSKFIKEKQIKSIALPPLGCGNGKLEWNNVKFIIELNLNDINGVDIQLFEPSFVPANFMNREKPELTPARAILIKLFKSYQILGYELNLLVAQKLSYFLQRLGEDLHLKFEKGTYGPYSHNLHHFLSFLNGSYLIFNSENNSPDTLIEIIQDMIPDIEEFAGNKLSDVQMKRLNDSINLIDGFQTPFSLEVLATVDFILQYNKDFTQEDILKNIRNWTKRKRQLMKPYHIEVAYNRLNDFRHLLTSKVS